MCKENNSHSSKYFSNVVYKTLGFTDIKQLKGLVLQKLKVL